MRNKSVSFEFAEIGVGGLIDLCCVSDGEEEEQNKDNILFKAQIVFLFMKLIPYNLLIAFLLLFFMWSV